MVSHCLKDVPTLALGAPKGMVAVLKGFLISAVGLTMGCRSYFERFLQEDSLGGRGRIFEGVPPFCNRNP